MSAGPRGCSLCLEKHTGSVRSQRYFSTILSSYHISGSSETSTLHAHSTLGSPSVAKHAALLLDAWDASSRQNPLITSTLQQRDSVRATCCSLLCSTALPAQVFKETESSKEHFWVAEAGIPDGICGHQAFNLHWKTAVNNSLLLGLHFSLGTHGWFTRDWSQHRFCPHSKGAKKITTPLHFQ